MNEPNDTKIYSVVVGIIGFIVVCVCVDFFVDRIISKEHLFKKRIYLHSRLKDVSGLFEGMPVYFRGLRIGRVKSIEVMSEKPIEHRMTFEIFEDYRDIIYKGDAVVKPLFSTVLDEVQIYRGTEDPIGKPVEDGDYLPFLRDNIFTNASLMLEVVNDEVIPGIKSFFLAIKDKYPVLKRLHDDGIIKIKLFRNLEKNILKAKKNITSHSGSADIVFYSDTTVASLCEINNLIVESAARGEILSREAVSLIVDADDLMREIDIFLEDFFSRRSRYFKKGENK